jgi:putative PIN family toxin of toxin-antitoxin system
LVLDSNIIISALFWEGNERTLLERGRSREHTSVISEPILVEVETVLRKKFNVPDDRIRAFFQGLIMSSDMVLISGWLHVIEDDPEDNMVIETAIMGKADLIITGDRHLLKMERYDNIKISKASDFLSSDQILIAPLKPLTP